MFSAIEKVTGIKFSPAKIPGLAGILKTAKLNSIPAEVIEELINIPLQGLLIGDEPLSEVTLKDVWGTVWTTAGFAAILGGAANPGGTINGIRRARNYDVIKMFGKDNVSAVRDAIIAGDKSQWTVAMVMP